MIAFDGEQGCFAAPVYQFRQTAARAPALEPSPGHIFAEFGARGADIRGPYTATLNVAHRKGLPVRLFGEKTITEDDR